MEKNGMKVVYRDGGYWEDLEAAAERYRVPVSVIKERLGKQLFWGSNPCDGVKMVCGVLPEWVTRYENTPVGKTGSASVWEILYYLVACPTNKMMPNVMWGVFWFTIGLVLINCVNSVLGGALLFVVGAVKFVFCVRWAIEHPEDPNKVVYVDGGCYGGDGFFDEVSDRRRSDIQFLLGTGPFAR